MDDMPIIISGGPLTAEEVPLQNGLLEQKTDTPEPGFMTDVKYIEGCCEADRLIGKEMKDLQEDGWGACLKGFPVSVCRYGNELEEGRMSRQGWRLWPVLDTQK